MFGEECGDEVGEGRESFVRRGRGEGREYPRHVICVSGFAGEWRVKAEARTCGID